MKLIIILVLLMITLINAFRSMVKAQRSMVNMRRLIVNMSLQYDSQGYVIKPRDWFNGLSTDPGGSLTGTHYHRHHYHHHYHHHHYHHHYHHHHYHHHYHHLSSLLLTDPRAVPPVMKAFAEKIKR